MEVEKQFFIYFFIKIKVLKKINIMCRILKKMLHDKQIFLPVNIFLCNCILYGISSNIECDIMLNCTFNEKARLLKPHKYLRFMFRKASFHLYFWYFFLFRVSQYVQLDVTKFFFIDNYFELNGFNSL